LLADPTGMPRGKILPPERFIKSQRAPRRASMTRRLEIED
jgi:hypothetical protein